jgi:hypothetical protein
MRRALVVAGYVVAGILNTWLGLFLASLMDFSGLPALISRSEACGDLGQCDLASSSIAALTTVLLLPTAAHALVGFLNGRKGPAGASEHMRFIALLMVSTIAFYALLRALHAV